MDGGYYQDTSTLSNVCRSFHSCSQINFPFLTLWLFRCLCLCFWQQNFRDFFQEIVSYIQIYQKTQINPTKLKTMETRNFLYPFFFFPPVSPFLGGNDGISVVSLTGRTARSKPEDSFDSHNFTFARDRVNESLNPVRRFATPWTRACQTPLSMEFSRPKYWSGQLFPSPEDLPTPALPCCRQILYHLSRQGSQRQNAYF